MTWVYFLLKDLQWKLATWVYSDFSVRNRNFEKCHNNHLGETCPAPLSAKDALGWLVLWFLKDCFTSCPSPAEYGRCCTAHLFLEKKTRRDNQWSTTQIWGVKLVLLKYINTHFINTSSVHQMNSRLLFQRWPFHLKRAIKSLFYSACFQSSRLTTLPHHLVGFGFNFLVFGKVSSGSFEVFFLHWRTLLFHGGWLRNRPTHQYFVFEAQGTKLPQPKGYNIQVANTIFHLFQFWDYTQLLQIFT